MLYFETVYTIDYVKDLLIWYRPRKYWVVIEETEKRIFNNGLMLLNQINEAFE